MLVPPAFCLLVVGSFAAFLVGQKQFTHAPTGASASKATKQAERDNNFFYKAVS
jgi:hypothetical protein